MRYFLLLVFTSCLHKKVDCFEITPTNQTCQVDVQECFYYRDSYPTRLKSVGDFWLLLNDQTIYTCDKKDCNKAYDLYISNHCSMKNK